MKQIAAICLLVFLVVTCFAVCGCSINAKPIPTPEAAAPAESSLPTPEDEEIPASTPYSPSEAETDTDAASEVNDEDLPTDAVPATEKPAVEATPAPPSAPTPQPSPEAEISTYDYAEDNLPSSYDASGGAIELPEIEF